MDTILLLRSNYLYCLILNVRGVFLLFETEKEIKNVERIISQAQGKKANEISESLIYSLYTCSFKYLELLRGLKNN